MRMLWRSTKLSERWLFRVLFEPRFQGETRHTYVDAGLGDIVVEAILAEEDVRKYIYRDLDDVDVVAVLLRHDTGEHIPNRV